MQKERTREKRETPAMADSACGLFLLLIWRSLYTMRELQQPLRGMKATTSLCSEGVVSRDCDEG